MTESQHTPPAEGLPETRSPVAVSSDPALGAKGGDLTELSTFHSRAGRAGAEGRAVGQTRLLWLLSGHAAASAAVMRHRDRNQGSWLSCRGEGHCGHVSASEHASSTTFWGPRSRSSQDGAGRAFVSSLALEVCPDCARRSRPPLPALGGQQRRSALSTVAGQPQGKPRETVVNSGPDERACPGSDWSPAPTLPSVQR